MSSSYRIEIKPQRSCYGDTGLNRSDPYPGPVRQGDLANVGDLFGLALHSELSSAPQSGKRSGPDAVPQRQGLVAVVQQNSHFELIAREARQLFEST